VKADVVDNRRDRGRIARLVLAGLLLAMAAGQIADLPGFVELLRRYPVGSSVPWLLAVALIIGEAGGGALLLSRAPATRSTGATMALAVAVAWSVLALAAFTLGRAIDNCGCFGVYLGQPLRWWVLIEDLEFVLLALWVLFQARRWAAPSRAGRRARATRKEGAMDVLASRP
jgi:hypothetical protein